MAQTTTSTLPSNSTLIRNFYQVLTVSQPSDSLVNSQAQRVDKGIATLGETLRQVYASPSHSTGPADALAKLFFLVFDRAPDYDNYTAAFAYLRGGGKLADLAEIALALPGYALSNDGVKNKDFLKEVYYRMKGATLSEDEATVYAGMLDSKQYTRGQVIELVAKSGTIAHVSDAKVETSLVYLAIAQREASSAELDQASLTFAGRASQALKAAGYSPTGAYPALTLDGTSLRLDGDLGSDLVFNQTTGAYALGGKASFKVAYSGDGGVNSSLVDFTKSLVTGAVSLDASGATGKGKVTYVGSKTANNIFYAPDAGSTASGGNGDDTLVGGAGKDTLIATAGKDSLTGGAGDDTFTFAASTVYLDGKSQATIKDFGNGKDTLDFSRLLNKAADTGKVSAITADSTAETALANGGVTLVENNGVWVSGAGAAAVARAPTAAEVAALFGASLALANPTQAGKSVVITSDIRNGADVWLINNDKDVAAVTSEEVILVGHIDGSWNALLTGLQAISLI